MKKCSLVDLNLMSTQQIPVFLSIKIFMMTILIHKMSLKMIVVFMIRVHLTSNAYVILKLITMIIIASHYSFVNTHFENLLEVNETMQFGQS
jgi:hypothetical protein